VTELENLLEQVDVIEVGADLARTAGDLAQHHGLCGYDAVAAALAAADDDVVLVTGDADLATAAADAGLAVARPTG
jgi:predicted nucleic acid-binding protein